MWGKNQATLGRGKDPCYLGTEGMPPTYLRALGSDYGKVPADTGLQAPPIEGEMPGGQWSCQGQKDLKGEQVRGRQ